MEAVFHRRSPHQQSKNYAFFALPAPAATVQA
jgi:hypothetical protein